MTRPIRLDLEARKEFDGAYDYFDGERDGLADEFATEIQKVFRRIAKFPKMHTVVYKGVRRAVVERFHYCVYYREEIESIRIVSVFHTSRNRSIWKKRV